MKDSKIEELRYDLYSKPLKEYDNVLETLSSKLNEVIRKVNDLEIYNISNISNKVNYIQNDIGYVMRRMNKLESQPEEHKCEHGMSSGSYCLQCGATVFFVRNEPHEDPSPKKEYGHNSFTEMQRNSMTNQTPQWKQDWDIASHTLITRGGLCVIDHVTHNWELDPEYVEKFLEEQIEKARKETEKAFGGCTKCYGKGYGSNEIKLVTCKCSRGKDMQGILEKTWIEGCKEAEKTSVIFQVENERDRWAKEGAERESKGFKAGYEKAKKEFGQFEYMNLDYDDGMKAGLQRAIDIAREKLFVMSCTCLKHIEENLKKEMEK